MSAWFKAWRESINYFLSSKISDMLKKLTAYIKTSWVNFQILKYINLMQEKCPLKFPMLEMNPVYSKL